MNGEVQSPGRRVQRSPGTPRETVALTCLRQRSTTAYPGTLAIFSDAAQNKKKKITLPAPKGEGKNLGGQLLDKGKNLVAQRVNSAINP